MIIKTFRVLTIAAFMLAAVASLTFAQGRGEGRGRGEKQGRGDGQGRMEKIDAAAVPQAVKDAFAKEHAAISNPVWHKRKGQKGEAFVASWNAGTGGKRGMSRATYHADGTAVKRVSHVDAAGLPQAVQDAAKRDYPQFTVKGGAKIERLHKGETVYRVRMRKERAATLMAFYTADGKAVDKKGLDPEDEDDDQNEE